MGNAKLLPAIGIVLLAAVAGCGDGPICQSEILLLIQTPQGVVLDDSNEDMAGVQTDVRVRSTLPENVDVELTVLDDNGDEVYSDSAPTDENGDVTFEDVDLPDGAATVRVSADAGECGSDEDEVSLDVASGRGCELELRQEPIDIDFYAPLGVFNLSNDDNPTMPNFQADIDVTTAAGYDVELFVVSDTGGETSAGTETASGTGAAAFSLSLGQGRQLLRAVCSNGAVSTNSITTAVFVDTEAPTCTLTDPAPGDDIGTADDSDSDASNGIQTTLTAHADGGDVEGEAVSFVITEGASMTTVAGTDFDAGGDTSADVTFALPSTPLATNIQLLAQDHAENACDEMEDFDLVCSLPALGDIGGPCGFNAQCGTADSTCYRAGSAGFAPEGYCMEDDFSLLAGVCATDGDCDPGTICVTWTDFAPYKSCMPACSCPGGACPTNQDCLMSFNGLALDRAACVPGNGDAVDGSTCAGLYQCDEYSGCFDDLEYPNGQCARYSCTLGNDSTCNGGHCVNADPPFGGTTCVDTCTGNSECRTADGYVCFDPDGAGSAPNYCRHPHVGDPCTSAASCGGAPFVCKGTSSFPGGYCSLDSCDPPGDLAGCTDGSACYDDPALTTNYCVDRCTGIGTQSTCRTGYVCTDTNPGAAVVGGCTPP